LENISSWVIEKPGIYLNETKEELLQATGIDISEGRICRHLREWGFTRQKMSLAAIQRDEVVRAEYILEMSLFSSYPNFFVFVDEMGSDKRDQKRKHAYCLRGSTPTVKRFLYRGQHISTVAAMTCNGILDFSTYVGGVTANVFDNFLSNVLLPHLLPFNGINPYSILVMDNATIHHAGEVVQLIQQAGVLVYYLPPYSPDLNPIEEAFSKVKSVLKSNEANWNCFDIETAISAAFNCVTPKDCQAWVSHAGYN